MQRRNLLRWLGAGLVVAAGGVLFTRTPRNRYYAGPPTDHFDGTRFFNPGHPDPKGFGDLLRWQFSGAREEWPASAPSPHRDHPPPRVEGAELRISFVGHATFLIQTAGLNILCDPVWSERASPVSFAGPGRVNEPGIPLGNLPPIDVVLVTHNHYDHLDLDTLARLQELHGPRVVAPLGNEALIRRHIPAMQVISGDWGDVVEVGGGCGSISSRRCTGPPGAGTIGATPSGRRLWWRPPGGRSTSSATPGSGTARPSGEWAIATLT